MKREALRERVELLAIGETLGYPRLGYGRSTKIPHDKRIPAGQAGWEKFCAHAHVNRILPALRISRVLREHGVKKYNPLQDGITITVDDVEVGDIDDGSRHTGEDSGPPPVDLLEEEVIT